MTRQEFFGNISAISSDPKQTTSATSLLSSIKNDPKNFPPESDSEKEKLSDDQSSSTDGKSIYFFVWQIDFEMY